MNPTKTLWKKPSLALFVVLASMGPLIPAKAATIGYSTDFSVPPYALAPSSINGVDGWDMRNGLPGDATVVAAPWDSSETVLRLKRSSGTGIPNVNALNKTAEPLTGRVNIALNAAFEYGAPGGTAFIFAFENMGSVSPRLSFGMDYNSGLYYRYRAPGSTVSTTVSILSLTEVKPLSMYNFTLGVDTDEDTFSFAISGLKADNSVLDYSISNVSFTGFAQISNFYLWQSSSTGTAYVDSLSVQPIPEPGTAALLSIALLGGGLLRFKGRKRKRLGGMPKIRGGRIW